MAGDCNDTDAAIRPTSLEVCDGVDNNCNHEIDEGCGDDDDSSDAGDDDDDTAIEPPEGCQCNTVASAPPLGLLLCLVLLGAFGRRRYSIRRTE